MLLMAHMLISTYCIFCAILFVGPGIESLTRYLT